MYKNEKIDNNLIVLYEIIRFMKRLFRIEEKRLSEANKTFVDMFDLPDVNRQMAIYFSHETEPNKEVHLKLRNKHCFVKFITATGNNKSVPVEFSIKNKGIKSLLKFLSDAGYKKATVGETVILAYKRHEEVMVEMILNSFIGDIMYVLNDKKMVVLEKRLEELISKKVIFEENKTAIPEVIEKLSLEKVQIIDGLGSINKDVFDFCRSNGINVSDDLLSLGDQVDSFMNDYEMFEDKYKWLTDVCLIGSETLTNKALYKPVSVIIPSFNSESTILKTLAAIQSQDLPQNGLKETEVIIVDDGSTVPVEEVIGRYKGKIITQLKIVRLVTNSGLSVARNIGVDMASKETVVFMDSDILLSKNYLLEMSVRSQIIPNAVFVAFKENVDKDCKTASFDLIEKGLGMPDITKDMRIAKNIMENAQGLVKLTRKRSVEILSETNYFKDFGFGRKVGIFDLPSMIIGHNMCMRRNTFFKVGGFSKEFKGWGMEDTYFGARLIARRNFIIPVLSSGVYHIDHPARSGSEEKKQKEFTDNLKRYVELMNKPFDVD